MIEWIIGLIAVIVWIYIVNSTKNEKDKWAWWLKPLVIAGVIFFFLILIYIFRGKGTYAATSRL